jgi:hypothetical protein
MKFTHSHLIDYLNGELPSPEREQLEAQLASDPALRLELDQLQSTTMLLTQALAEEQKLATDKTRFQSICILLRSESPETPETGCPAFCVGPCIPGFWEGLRPASSLRSFPPSCGWNRPGLYGQTRASTRFVCPCRLLPFFFRKASRSWRLVSKDSDGPEPSLDREAPSLSTGYRGDFYPCRIPDYKWTSSS